jgi:pentatricopeptide repeat protein
LKLASTGHDTHVYNNLLWKIVQNGDADRAKYYYREMIDANVAPDVETFAIVLASSIVDKSPSRATYYLQEMIRQGFVPPKYFLTNLSKLLAATNEATFSRVVDTLAGKGDLKVADFDTLLNDLNSKFRK